MVYFITIRNVLQAVEIRSKDCVELLVKSSADVNIKANDNRSPFDFAIQEYGDQEMDIVGCLYAAVKQQKADGFSLTPLHKLCLSRFGVSVKNTAEMLLEFEDINCTEGRGR